MKTNIFKILLPAFFLAAFSLASVESMSQTRKLPDGTIVYPDGSKKLPNGTVIKKDGTVRKRSNDVRLPGGEVARRDRRYNDERRNTPRNHRVWMPPGQAKKVYGGSARDYAPGQQKKWKKNKNRKHHDYDERGDHGRSQGKHGGKGHKD